ncbi:Heterokaryon incompatibility protein 6, OR allele [Colletotrichum siamense]|uniref:Heterokaryon incompatibility protein 6, OR allele n=1 Tax=Colletotrichum siamense TaxID=690259 RepID=A0A9P5K5J0_COLSI|nr:Heterokaryon incompatibility protein 6, OR allele [Colletotrichum siamense]KAF4859490.1 Heterokaryon incompatibility protein 6, OR allele [Colletotrichum siamense]
MRQPREDMGTSLEALPPDEPEGHLGLWWPPSVPYSSNEPLIEIKNNEKSSTDGPILSGVKSDIQKASAKTSLSSASLANDQVYERALTPSQFRLAYLSAIPSKSDTTYPIHLSFDIFEDNHRPDYDAVSYAWGGEDNNRDHNSPIYIGEYWDILHATRNCWAVLRYLRPWKGTRFIWLDFVCINQRDTEEKVQQIRKMGQIYSQCSQVFLWLGEDAVCHDQVALPSRRPLEDLEDIHTILLRNYFTRVWVIQELVLSRRISMPYVSTVYEASPQSLGHMEKTLATSRAPWLKLATQGSSHNLSWTEVMRLTSQSKSSDVRDGLYGILGLWPSDSNLPFPSYAISYQHMMTGLFAWSLTCERDLRILYAARGVSFSGFEDASPSWAPPLRNHNVWEWLVEGSSLDQIHYYKSLTLEGWSETEGPDPEFVDELTDSDGRPWDFQINIDRDNGRLSLWTTNIRATRSDCWKVKNYKPAKRIL